MKSSDYDGRKPEPPYPTPEDLENSMKPTLFEIALNEVAMLRAQLQMAANALRIAKDTIRAWHGEEAWDIYDRESPEMKSINAALAKLEQITP